MSEQNTNLIIKTNGEVVVSSGDLMLVKIYLRIVGTSDVLFAIIKRFENDILVMGVGLTTDGAFLDVKRRANELDNIAILERVEALERKYYDRIYERGKDNE